MIRFARAALGWFVGALVWAGLYAVLSNLWAVADNLNASTALQAAKAGLSATPAAFPGALVFLLIGLAVLFLLGRRSSSVGAGLFGGLLFLLASGLAWHFGRGSSQVAVLFGLFPIDTFWGSVKAIMQEAMEARIGLAVQIVLVLVSSAIGGGVYGAISAAARYERRKARRPAVDFGRA